METKLKITIYGPPKAPVKEKSNDWLNKYTENLLWKQLHKLRREYNILPKGE